MAKIKDKSASADTMELVQYPDERLSKPSEKVELNKELFLWLEEFLRFYHEKLPPYKMGLAAPQVGRNVRVFIAFGKVFINPEYVFPPSGTKVNYMDRYGGTEGCFSIENGQKQFPSKRYSSVKLRWQTLEGEYVEEIIGGLNTAVVQHEMDHLEGKLCHDNG